LKPHPFNSPGVFRRVGSLLYDGLLLIAILFFATLLFLFVVGDATDPPEHFFLQLYLWLVGAMYFGWNWHRSGQTLAMQTWRLRVVSRMGEPITWSMAIKRYLFATLFFGLGFLWAIFDREGLYLHDRLGGTRLIWINA
jgi:uncharacterized RDD family membrane protein YckC